MTEAIMKAPYEVIDGKALIVNAGWGRRFIPKDQIKEVYIDGGKDGQASQSKLVVELKDGGNPVTLIEAGQADADELENRARFLASRLF